MRDVRGRDAQADSPPPTHIDLNRATFRYPNKDTFRQDDIFGDYISPHHLGLSAVVLGITGTSRPTNGMHMHLG